MYILKECIRLKTQSTINGEIYREEDFAGLSESSGDYIGEERREKKEVSYDGSQVERGINRLKS